MLLALPEDVEQRLTPESAALSLAIGLFVREEATLGQAAAIAKLSQGEFMQELGRRKISMHYGLKELEEDLAAVREMLGE